MLSTLDLPPRAPPTGAAGATRCPPSTAARVGARLERRTAAAPCVEPDRGTWTRGAGPERRPRDRTSGRAKSRRRTNSEGYAGAPARQAERSTSAENLADRGGDRGAGTGLPPHPTNVPVAPLADSKIHTAITCAVGPPQSLFSSPND